MRIRWFFVLYAVLEMAVIVALVATIGFGWTVMLLAGALLLGLLLAGSQIKGQMAVLQRDLRGARDPGARITDGALVAIGSVLMIVPGLVTSLAGLLLLLPPSRSALRPLAGSLAGRTLATRVGFVMPRPAYIDGEVIDVQRETHLGGPIHAKGVMILSAFLAARFSRQAPHSLLASLVFEQTYGMVEGDSASLAELSALLSSIGDVPVRQGWAMTGSVNQFGDAQAVGGVNEKIEGFFDLCNARGLTGSQGVMIPKANLPHLVLREDVAQAIGRGQFHLYAISSVADGIEILTGLPAGDRDSSGRFPAASVFGRVERRIIEIAERLRQAEAHGYDGGMEGMEDGGAEISEGGEFRRLSRPRLPITARR